MAYGANTGLEVTSNPAEGAGIGLAAVSITVPLPRVPVVQGRSSVTAPSPFKFLTVVSFPLLDHVDKVIGENEGDTLTVDSKLGLEVPQEVAEIDMEQLTGRNRQRIRSQGEGLGCGSGVEP